MKKAIAKYTLESLMIFIPFAWLAWAAAVIPQAGIIQILAVFVGLGITLAAEQFLSGILWDCLTDREKEEVAK